MVVRRQIKKKSEKRYYRQRVTRRFAKFAENHMNSLRFKQFIQRFTRRLARFADEVTLAGCGMDFEGISSPQSPVITARVYRTCKGVVGGQAQMIVQESARGMTQVKGSEKVPMTPTTPTARRQDLDQERLSTRTSSSESQHISTKYTRYLKAVHWGSRLH